MPIHNLNNRCSNCTYCKIKVPVVEGVIILSRWYYLSARCIKGYFNDSNGDEKTFNVQTILNNQKEVVKSYEQCLDFDGEEETEDVTYRMEII